MKHQGTVTLETERLILRRFAVTDAEAMFRNWASSEEVARYLTWEPHENPAVTEAILRQHGYIKGRIFDDVWYGILADEYREMQHGTE